VINRLFEFISLFFVGLLVCRKGEGLRRSPKPNRWRSVFRLIWSIISGRTFPNRYGSACEARDPHLRKLAGQIEEIAKDVHGATGFEWHSDQTAHQIFVEALRLLFANLPVPKTKKSKVALDPAAAAAIIYNRYAATVRELERTRKTGMRTPLSQLLENDDG
jgi:hypothetical protein